MAPTQQLSKQLWSILGWHYMQKQGPYSAFSSVYHVFFKSILLLLMGLVVANSQSFWHCIYSAIIYFWCKGKALSVQHANRYLSYRGTPISLLCRIYHNCRLEIAHPNRLDAILNNQQPIPIIFPMPSTCRFLNFCNNSSVSSKPSRSFLCQNARKPSTSLLVITATSFSGIGAKHNRKYCQA